MDDETEREIMSRLDEILPDTPVFDEKGFGAQAAPFEADSKIVDFELAGEEDAVPEVEARADTESEEPQWPEPEAPKSDRAAPSKRPPPMVMDADDVMKLTRPRRRPRPEVPATPAFKISRPIIITVVLGAIAVIISLILGRV